MSTESRFDDPELKATLKGILGDQRAPESLRLRVGRLIEESRSQPAAPTRLMPFWRRSAWGLAIAAVLAIGVLGVVRSVLWPDSTRVQAAGIDRDLLQAMVRCHQNCCEHGEHRRGDGTLDVRSAGREMEQKLHAAVLAADLGGEGWELRGAEVCQGCGCSSSHMVFSRRAARMSVFSVPVAKSGRAEEGKIQAECIDGYMVAGFVRNGVVYCMVGHCPNKNLKLSEVADLVQKHQGELIHTVAARLPGQGPDYH